MNIRTRIALALTVILVVNLGAGLYGVDRYKKASADAARECDRTSEIVGNSLSAQIHFKKQVQEWKNILLRGHEPGLYQKYLSQFEAEEQQTRVTIQHLIQMLGQNPPARKVAQEFLEAHIQLGKKYRKAVVEYRPERPNPHIRVDLQVRGIDRQPLDLLDRVVELAKELKAEQLERLQTSTRNLERRIFFLLVGVMSGTIVFFLWLIDRSIARPIAVATGIAKRISEGDLSSAITIRGRDETAQLLRSLKTMQSNLAENQETLLNSEERTRLLLESSGEGIYGVDTDGLCIFCNPSGARMFGYARPDELMGREIHSIIHHTRIDGSSYPLAECKASQTYRDGIPAHVDDELFWRADGSSFPVEYRSHPICRGDNLDGAVVTFSDITVRKQSEIALRVAHRALAEERTHLTERVRERTEELHLANAKLARSARSKDEFLASMSHELRTPLTSILGTAETLAEEMLGVMNDRQRKAAKIIQESGYHLLSLINDILDVAKLESGNMELSWDDIPMEQLCEASLRLIRQTAESKNLNVSLDLDPRVRVVRGDGRRLKQLLVNLLGNAVKFTPEGGSVGLKVRGHPEQGNLSLLVWDTGIGVPADKMDKLFKAFVQLDTKLSRQYTGTGLGLALVHGMAELHGGRVTVKSTPGQGSQFCVYLPWENQTQQPTDLMSSQEGLEAPPRAELTTTPGRILLAEDNEDNAEMLSSYLRHLGHEVTVAHSGAETVAKASIDPPDLVLMDIQMPEMDGLEATRQLRVHPTCRTLPIIALTALVMPGDRERCLEAGVDDYLSKPVGLKELNHTLEVWLRRSRRL